MTFMTTPVNAAYSYYNTYSFTTGALWWKEKFTAKVYRDPNWFRVWYGSDKVSSGFEYKNNTEVVLTQSRSFNLDSQTKFSLNPEVDFSGYKVPAKVGGSIEKTSKKSWGITNISTRTIEKTAPKGYYSYNVCMNLYKIKIEKYSGKTKKGTIQFFVPRSEAFRAVVYNKKNASYSGVTLY
ncbi:hypothetical protein [Herbinix luporum]|uniref:hypothetical protein n=1 Tax=Herbinix luporum TaxID=1679721 RepID=UPI0017634B97|nr:hypothetical protein [Herbinix luporum]HHT56319.1 hypothetical protein [Herbinix luporum]